MGSSRFAIVSQVSDFVNVESVKTGRQSSDGPADDDGSTCRRLLEVQPAADIRPVGRAVNVGHRRNRSLLFNRIDVIQSNQIIALNEKSERFTW